MYKLTVKGFVIAALITLAITSVWYGFEYLQFGELQWDRRCDEVVTVLYFFALWVGFSNKNKTSGLDKIYSKIALHEYLKKNI